MPVTLHSCRFRIEKHNGVAVRNTFLLVHQSHQLLQIVAGEPAETNFAMTVIAVKLLPYDVVPAMEGDFLLAFGKRTGFDRTGIKLWRRVPLFQILQLLRDRRRRTGRIVRLKQMTLRLVLSVKAAEAAEGLSQNQACWRSFNRASVTVLRIRSIGSRADTGRASVFASAGANQICSGGQHLIANFIQRTAETNPSRIVVVNENRGIEHRIVRSGIHGSAQIAPIAHQKDAG